MAFIDRHYPNKGNNNLDFLNTLYNSKEEWLQRAQNIRQGLLQGALLDPLPKRTPLNSKIHSRREHDGYSVENVYFESLPGFFVTGNLYRPLPSKISGKCPILMIPHGHFKEGRFEPDFQNIAATVARMGAVAFTYDMIGWPDSDNTHMDHKAPHLITFQLWNSIRTIDFLTTLPNVDSSKIAVTGASGGGTQTFLLTAVDDRVSVSVPAVMVSSKFYGGCVCESAMPIHKKPKHGTNNAEIAATTAPRPLLLISIGNDWTRYVPIREYPYIQRIYKFFDAEKNVENWHIPNETHNYGSTKRKGLYPFLVKHLGLNAQEAQKSDGSFDESKNTIEAKDIMRAFNANNPRPATTMNSDEEVLKKMQELQL
jgi:uncharacterized protein